MAIQGNGDHVEFQIRPSFDQKFQKQKIEEIARQILVDEFEEKTYQGSAKNFVLII